MFKNNFIQNILKLLTGTTLAHLITFLFAPILTRIYTPSEFGIYTLFLTIGTSLGAFSTVRYEMAVILPKKEKEASYVVKLCILMTIIVTTVFTLMGSIIPIFVSLPNYNVLLFSLFILLTGFYQTFYYQNNRYQNFSKMGNSRIVQTTSFSLITMILSSFGSMGLIFSHLCSLVLSLVYLLKRNTLKYFKINTKEFANILYVAKKYKDMPKYNSLHVLMDLIANNGVFMIISVYYGSTVLGLYSFAWKTLRAPLAMIGAAIGQVYINRATILYNNGEEIIPLIKSILKRLVLLAGPIFIVLFLGSEKIFNLAFGSEWSEAGKYVQIMSPWLFFNFIGSPIVQTFVVLNKQKQALIYSSIQTTLIILVVYSVSLFTSNAIVLITSLSIVGSVTTIIFILWIYIIVKEYQVGIVERKKGEGDAI